MNSKFKDRYTVSDKQWAEHIERKYLDRVSYLAEPDEFGEVREYNAATKASIELLRTGCVESYLDNASKNGFTASWRRVLDYTRTRDYDQLIKNIGLFWEWVLEDPSTRIEYEHKYDEPKAENYFWSGLGGLSDGGLLRDPQISVRLFREIYGETYRSEIEFPYELGTTGWKPKKLVDGSRLFFSMMLSLKFYLFIREPEKHISNGVVLAHLEYWFSLFEEVGPQLFKVEGYATLFFDPNWRDRRDSENLQEFARRQYILRSFLEKMLGYNVDTDGEVNARNDPEVANYILGRINEMEMPDEFNQLIEFIHRHKENSIEASEGDPDPRTPFYKDPSIVELYEETDFILDLQSFCKQHGFVIEEPLWAHVCSGELWEVNEGLFSVFEAYGTIGYVETGEPPKSFLVTYVNLILKLLDCSSWEIESVTSKDNWESAVVMLKEESGERYELNVPGIAGSDMVPEELFDSFYIFAALHADKILKVMCSDDAILMLPLTQLQYYELKNIISDRS